MMTWEQRFKRNFIVVCITHAVVIVGLVLFEWIMPTVHKSFATEVDLVVPADILGDLPQGPTVGRGAYAPPRAEPAAPSQPSLPAVKTAEEAPAPKVAPRSEPVERAEPLQHGEIAIPKARTTKRTKTTTTAKAERQPVRRATSTGSSAAKNGAAKGASAADIRNVFAKALATEEGGTPYGDGRPGGGGSGKSRVIGSPNGSPNGVVGGVGKGTPFWWYYEHVHDKMYEAWERPSDAVNWDRSLMVTIIITVERDGRITDVRLKVSSGNKQMDESAMAAAKRVRQLQPLPDGLGTDAADISVNFQLEG